MLIIVGLASRPLSLLVSIAMIAAYFTADFEAISSILSDSDKFVKADPFPFLFAALIIYVFGAGLFSVDALLQGRKKRSLRHMGAGNGPAMESPTKMTRGF